MEFSPWSDDHMSDKTEVKGGEHSCDMQRDHLGTGGSATFGSGHPGGIRIDCLCVTLSLVYNVGVLGVWWDCFQGVSDCTSACLLRPFCFIAGLIGLAGSGDTSRWSRQSR
jgi:hypothetical protein